jgi:RHS repeat-associated protein
MEVYFYLPDGRLVATYERIWRWGPEYPNEWCLRRVGERVWFAGTLLTVDGVPVYTDRLGSVVRRGTQVYRYYPHGEPFGTNPVTAGPHFATYERDQVAGLDQAWNRGYLPTYGRFAQADPYQASGGAEDPGSWNRYGYVGGDPVNYNDPPGLFRSVADMADSWVPLGGPIYYVGWDWIQPFSGYNMMMLWDGGGGGAGGGIYLESSAEQFARAHSVSLDCAEGLIRSTGNATGALAALNLNYAQIRHAHHA